jgi:hypothetical protein
MSPSDNDLFLGMTAKDGNVYTSIRAAGDGSWAPWSQVPSLTRAGFKNIAVTVTPDQQICALNNAPLRQLRCTTDLTGTTAPLVVRSGVAPASAEAGGGSFSLAALGIGPPKTPPWSFGLLLSLVHSDHKTVVDAGDVLANLDAGAFDPANHALALDLAGTFDDNDRSFHLVLATAGQLYYAFQGPGGRGAFQSVLASNAIPSVSCALGFEGLHVCLTDSAGKLFHTIRRADTTWTEWADLNADIGTSETFAQVAISHHDLTGGTGPSGVLHLVGRTSSGGLLHAMRTAEQTPDPIWSPFEDIVAKAGNKGAVTSVDIGVQP